MGSWLWWVIAVVLAAVVIKFVGPSLLGRAISVGDGARFYLSAELKKWGIRHLFPDACVFEIADNVVEFWVTYAEQRGEGAMWIKTEMLPTLERDARVMQEWVRGRDIAGDSISYIPEALKKYGVPLGALKAKAPASAEN